MESRLSFGQPGMRSSHHHRNPTASLCQPSSSNRRRFPLNGRHLTRGAIILLAVHIVLLYHSGGQRGIFHSFVTLFDDPREGGLVDPYPGPGLLGQRLLDKYASHLLSSDVDGDDNGSGLSSDSDLRAQASDLDAGIAEGMFSLMAGRDESECHGWSPEAEAEPEAGASGLSQVDSRWRNCWRAKMWNQIEEWDFERSQGFTAGKNHLARNTRALDRLQRCLLQHNSTHPLPIYPSAPQTAISDSQSTRETYDVWRHTDPVEIELPCSLTATKVVVGTWWYFMNGFEDTAMSGEAVWIRSQIQALYEQGYTVLSTVAPEGMMDIHRVMPDVVSQIWTEDRTLLSCEDDPRCIAFDTFQPTVERRNPERTARPDNPLDLPGGKSRTWAWSEDAIRAIPEEERGTIPHHKLFGATYWGARPADNHWQTRSSGFHFNVLGSEWTLSPFDYPEHTFIPYSIEAECMKTPALDPKLKKDRIFVLGKLTEYFVRGGIAVPPTFWPELRKLTGLEAISVAIQGNKKDPERPPDGVSTVGKVSSAEFEEMLRSSKIMLAIGLPVISPSIYSALCQATPVAMPYNGAEPKLTGWGLFDPKNSQHGPALALGEPYVYGYQSGNTSMLVDVIRRAVETPIGRYIPPSMTHAAELQNVDDLMRFNWAEHGRAVVAAKHQQGVAQRALVIEHCFEWNRCWLTKPGRTWQWSKGTRGVY